MKTPDKSFTTPKLEGGFAPRCARQQQFSCLHIWMFAPDGCFRQNRYIKSEVSFAVFLSLPASYYSRPAHHARRNYESRVLSFGTHIYAAYTLVLIVR